MTTKRKCTVLSIEDKITICEHLDKGASKSEITREYNIEGANIPYKVLTYNSKQLG